MDSAEVVLGALKALAIVIGAGALTAALAQRLRVPDVALYLVMGIVIGPSVAGLVSVPAASGFNQFVLVLGASWLLFEGGASLRFSVLRRVWISIVSLATAGVLVTAAVTAAAAHLLLELPWPTALLLGAVLAPTDPATLVPIFAQVRIRERVAQTVISESAFNDAVGAIVTFVMLGLVAGSAPDAATVAVTFVREAGVGLGVGAVLGYVAADLVAHERRGVLRSFAPAAALAGVTGAYAAAASFHGSGFMAVFVFGLVFGNRDAFGLVLPERSHHQLEEFTSLTALVLRLLIFTLLGTQVNFPMMARVALPAAGLVVVFMLVARPLAVFTCAAPDLRARWSLRELLFMCWTRETGVIPAALAGLLLGQQVPGAPEIAAVTFVAILMTILIQAPTTRAVAGRLGLLES